jgi:hypothetical protein
MVPVLTFDNELEYWSADAYLFTSCCLCQRVNLRPFAGVRWSNVKDTGRIDITGDLGPLGGIFMMQGAAEEKMVAQDNQAASKDLSYGVGQEQEFKIIGLRVGLASDFWSSDCLSVGGQLAATMGLADVDRTFVIDRTSPVATAELVRINSDTSCTGMLGVDGDLGGRFHFCCGGFQAHVDVKYFAHAWHPLSPVGPNVLGFLPWNSGFVMHGVKLGVGASF